MSVLVLVVATPRDLASLFCRQTIRIKLGGQVESTNQNEHFWILPNVLTRSVFQIQ